MMLLPRFDFHEPTTIEEACQVLAAYGEKASLIAGGTDVLVKMKKGVLCPQHLISLGRIDELKRMDMTNGLLSIGVSITVEELVESEWVRDQVRALAEAAENLGSHQIRNLATIGGNIGTARPAADLPPALMAYGAKVVLVSGLGKRVFSLDEFFLGPGQTTMRCDEIITEIQIDTPPQSSGASYINLGVRKVQDINLVNAASYISLDAQGSVDDIRIVMGGVGPRPLRAYSAEKILIGKEPSSSLFADASDAACRDTKAIDDFRGSAEYKRDMAGVLT